MLRTAVGAFAVSSVTSISMAAQTPHPVPKDRSSLSERDWFPYVFGKVAPLEEWSVILSPEDVRRENYDSDTSYQQARANTSVIPHFCFRFFRIHTDAYRRLFSAVNGYQGAATWQRYGGCIGAFSQKLTFYPPFASANLEEGVQKLQEAIRNPPKPDPDFVRKAVDDIPRFCQYLESQLGLTGKNPLDFAPEWLTREGLQRSREVFDDFVEWGERMPILARISEDGKRRALADSQRPHFGLSGSEIGELLGELGAHYDRDPAVPKYPLLSRLSDITALAVYRPGEIDLFVAEISQAQVIAKQSSSLRALDKLFRIAKWAETYDAHIVFNGL